MKFGIKPEVPSESLNTFVAGRIGGYKENSITVQRVSYPRSDTAQLTLLQNSLIFHEQITLVTSDVIKELGLKDDDKTKIQTSGEDVFLITRDSAFEA